MRMWRNLCTSSGDTRLLIHPGAMDICWVTLLTSITWAANAHCARTVQLVQCYSPANIVDLLVRVQVKMRCEKTEETSGISEKKCHEMWSLKPCLGAPVKIRK